ncbi:arylamine N-acetyltransferase [Spirillospora sp. NPDC029432]|uniref:arylamine N-acetyltransferase family protein n=1 Tax=Spirillospora sp. NPDC029432 TaxID=3154599 RepID=UPI00345518CA
MTYPSEDLGWQGDLLDLDAYLERIGYEGDRAPTLEALRALQLAHVTAMPFENLEIVLGRPVPLGVEAVQEKMVRHRRGGYCFEHTELFAAALERFGFAFAPLAARVSMGIEKLLPATHAVALVEAGGGRWICDVGFGAGPLEPLPLTDGVRSRQGGWAYELHRLGPELGGLTGVEHWELVQEGPRGRVQRHTFPIAPAYRIDYDLGNYYISTHPRSPFTGRIFCQRYGPDFHHELDGARLISTVADGGAGSVEERVLEPGEVPKILATLFGIELDAADAAAVVAHLERP